MDTSCLLGSHPRDTVRANDKHLFSANSKCKDFPYPVAQYTILVMRLALRVEPKEST